MTVPDILYGVAKVDWIAYEQLRRSALINMFGSHLALDLIEAILKNYSEMKLAWETSVPVVNPFLEAYEATEDEREVALAETEAFIGAYEAEAEREAEAEAEAERETEREAEMKWIDQGHEEEAYNDNQ